MDMEFTMGEGGVPAGSYLGQFIGVEPYTENSERYGEGVLLRWRILGGESDGAEATRICSRKMSPKSNLAKFAAAIKGGPLAKGEAFRFDTYSDTQGMLVVEETENGGSRVATFIRQPAATPQAPENGQSAPPQAAASEQQAVERI